MPDSDYPLLVPTPRFLPAKMLSQLSLHLFADGFLEFSEVPGGDLMARTAIFLILRLSLEWLLALPIPAFGRAVLLFVLDYWHDVNLLVLNPFFTVPDGQFRTV